MSLIFCLLVEVQGAREGEGAWDDIQGGISDTSLQCDALFQRAASSKPCQKRVHLLQSGELARVVFRVVDGKKVRVLVKTGEILSN